MPVPDRHFVNGNCQLGDHTELEINQKARGPQREQFRCQVGLVATGKSDFDGATLLGT